MNKILLIYVSTNSNFFGIAQQLAISYGWQTGGKVTITNSTNLKWMIFDLYHKTIQYIHRDPDTRNTSILVAQSIQDILPYIHKLPPLIPIIKYSTFGSIRLTFGSIESAFSIL